MTTAIGSYNDAVGSMERNVLPSARRIKELADRSKGRLRVVDAESAYFRLRPAEESPEGLYKVLRELLRP